MIMRMVKTAVKENTVRDCRSRITATNSLAVSVYGVSGCGSAAGVGGRGGGGGGTAVSSLDWGEATSCSSCSSRSVFTLLIASGSTRCVN